MVVQSAQNTRLRHRASLRFTTQATTPHQPPQPHTAWISGGWGSMIRCWRPSFDELWLRIWIFRRPLAVSTNHVRRQLEQARGSTQLASSTLRLQRNDKAFRETSEASRAAFQRFDATYTNTRSDPSPAGKSTWQEGCVTMQPRHGTKLRQRKRTG